MTGSFVSLQGRSDERVWDKTMGPLVRFRISTDFVAVEHPKETPAIQGSLREPTIFHSLIIVERQGPTSIKFPRNKNTLTNKTRKINTKIRRDKTYQMLSEYAKPRNKKHSQEKGLRRR